MSYNLSAINFHKTQNKNKLTASNANQIINNDLRSSSAFEAIFQSSSKQKIIDDQVNKIYNYIPKYIKNKVNVSNLDIVLFT